MLPQGSILLSRMENNFLKGTLKTEFLLSNLAQRIFQDFSSLLHFSALSQTPSIPRSAAASFCLGGLILATTFWEEKRGSHQFRQRFYSNPNEYSKERGSVLPGSFGGWSLIGKSKEHGGGGRRTRRTRRRRGREEILRADSEGRRSRPRETATDGGSREQC